MSQDIVFWSLILKTKLKIQGAQKNKQWYLIFLVMVFWAAFLEKKWHSTWKWHLDKGLNDEKDCLPKQNLGQKILEKE